MLFNELPEIVKLSLFKDNLNIHALNKHIEVAEDSLFFRNKLESLGLIAFIADNSVLPRENGTSDKPMDKESSVLFRPPESLKVKIRSYSGRYIVKTDISSFIRKLPFQQDTTAFSTENASGSTSQAANIIEAIEIGAKVLLMDEDTCAINIMIRDNKMQQLVSENDEPITTFIDRVKQLYSEKDISSILVLRGIGDYFDVANQVIQMMQYRPLDVIQKAHEISKMSPVKRIREY